MIHIPSHIEQLRKYKPGKPGKDMFAGLAVDRTALLASNENNLGPSPLAIRAMREAAVKAHLYPDPTAFDLRERLASLYGKTMDQIIVHDGSDAILYSMFSAFFEPGDEFLTAQGSFVAVQVFAKMHNTPTVKVPLNGDYRFDLEEMAAHIGPRTKVIYLCNPNNPTGAIISKQELEAFLKIVPKHIIVIVDEAYYEYSSQLSELYPDSTTLGYDNVLTLRTFSKAYGLAGLRIGYGMGSEQVISALHKVKLTFDPNMMAQEAALAALEDNEHVNQTLKINAEALQYYYRAFDRLGLKYIPSYGNFVMLEMSSEAEVEWLYESLLKHGVLVRRLASFELPHCVRISTGLPEENQLLVEKLEKVLLEAKEPV